MSVKTLTTQRLSHASRIIIYVENRVKNKGSSLIDLLIAKHFAEETVEVSKTKFNVENYRRDANDGTMMFTLARDEPSEKKKELVRDPVAEKEARIEQHARACRYFNGLHHSRCKKNIIYGEMRARDKPHYPCLDIACSIACASRESLTRAEAEERENEITETIANMVKAREAALRHDALLNPSERLRNNQGRYIDCPVCNAKDALRYTIMANEHTHGMCNTPGCVSWMD